MSNRMGESGLQFSRAQARWERTQRARERRLVLRHRWHAGIIATLISAAMMVSGYAPAIADETATPSAAPADSPSSQSSETPSVEPTTTTGSEPTTAPEATTSTTAPPQQSASPVPTEMQTATATPTPTPTPPLRQLRDAPVALAAAAAGSIIIHAGGMRTATSTVSNLAGVVFQAKPVTGTTATLTCTTTSTGTCSITGAETGVQYDISSTAAPSGWYLNPTLDYGGAYSGTETPYVFRTAKMPASGNLDVPGATADSSYSDGVSPANPFLGLWQTSLNDNPLPKVCGLNIALVMDVSGSMSQTPDGASKTKLQLLKDSANSVVAALIGSGSTPVTPTKIALYQFAASASRLNQLTNNSTALTNNINGLSAGGGTNWDQGLYQVVGNNGGDTYDLVVVLTDGNPTTDHNGNGGGNNTRFDNTSNGIFSANAIKNLTGPNGKTRVVAIGIGVDGGDQNIRAISGTVQNDDYYLSSGANFGQTLYNVLLKNCSLTAVKKIQNADGTTTLAKNWAMTNTVTGSAAQTKNTAEDGAAVFGPLSPGTLGLTVTEKQQAGYTNSSVVCTYNDTGAAISTGATGTDSPGQQYGVTLSANVLSHGGVTCTFTNIVKTSPTITTQATTPVALPAGISDTATINGLTANATGTVTFSLFGPVTGTVGQNSCTAANKITLPAAFANIPIGTVAAGKAAVTSPAYTPAAVGTYLWVASYSGDTYNGAVTGKCGDANETSVVAKATPAFSTNATASVQLPASTITDTATLANVSANAGGTIQFKLYGPSQTSVCSGAAIYTSGTIAVNGPGTYGGLSAGVSFTPSAVGSYYWVASYSGDTNNNQATGACGENNETSTVAKSTPAISTTATGTAALPAGTIADTAVLTGLSTNATGSVTFALYGPITGTVGANSCTSGNKIALDSSFTVPIGTVTGGAATIHSLAYTPTAVGNYAWIASYPGDANNAAVQGACGEKNEVSQVTSATPKITTSATAAPLPSGTISDTATLTGLSAGATGTVTFQLFGPAVSATCTTPVKTLGPIAIGTVTGGTATVLSGPFTPTVAGDYYWVATYSGDANNAPVSGACGDDGETSTVSPASPAITTQATTQVALPVGAIKDTASLTGLSANATGTVTFTLHGPIQGAVTNNSCTQDNTINLGPTFTVQIVPGAGGTATAASPTYTPTIAGNYAWVASYSGDANNNPVAGGCNAANENSTVDKSNPAIATHATASVTLPGNAITDTATLSDVTATAGGTITFALYGPSSSPSCTGTPIYSSAGITVSGPGTYGTPATVSFTPTKAGTYYWVATYSGDANNNTVSGTCGDPAEITVVNPATPKITTNATPTASLPGGTISDTATVTGYQSPITGSVTFALYGPGDTTCAGTTLILETVPIAADGTAASSPYTPLAIGAYHWIATYNGDTNNAKVSGTCGEDGETSVVGQAAPRISTNATTPVALPSGTISDTANLTGLSANATGTVTFTLYGPIVGAVSSTSCTDANKTALTGATLPIGSVTGGKATVLSPSFTPTKAGNYAWVASYSGDANNAAVSGACGERGETSVVSPAVTKIVTQATGAALPGGSISDGATVSGLTADATGSVTFTVYGPIAGSVTATSCTTVAKAFGPVAIGAVSGGSALASSGTFVPTVAGNYAWIASYSGDANNASSTGVCGDLNETSTVTKAAASITTAASGAQLPAGTVHDVAALHGFQGPASGTVTFTLYANAQCTGTPVFTSTVNVAADGTATSGSFTPTKAGSYSWIASYSGDGNNAAASGKCGDDGETSVVAPATTSIKTAATGAQLPSGSVKDGATVSGLTSDASGTVTFSLYGPISGAVTSASCTPANLIESFAPVSIGSVSSGTASASSPSYQPMVAGNYAWVASYSGDANNAPSSGACGDLNETSTVTPAGPSITTRASGAQLPGGTIQDTAALHGFQAPATGTVTFTLYANAQCTGTAVFTSTVNVAANGTATSGTFTPTAAGSYYWVASYSGDANNAAVSGNCGDTGETSTVSPASTKIATTAVGAALPGGSISDGATVSGLTADATGSVTFTVYGPIAGSVTATSCTTVAGAFGPVAIGAVSGGSAQAASGTFVPTVAGNYAWIASYSGDANNAASTGACGDLHETSVVTKAGPTISTAATGAQLPAGSIHDTAALHGFQGPATGTVTFSLYGNAQCTGTAVFTSTANVAADGTATSAGFTPTAAGSYYWVAAYSGDANNTKVSGTCGEDGETSTVTPATTSIQTAAVGAVLPSGSIKDVAMLSGTTSDASGSVTFTLYANGQCAGNAVFTSTVPVPVGTTSVTSASFTPVSAGSYYWVASYSGDVNNAPSAGACGDEGETSVVKPAVPVIQTSATPDVTPVPSGTISDTAALTGLSGNAAGTVTFQVFGPSASPVCTSAVATLGPVPIEQVTGGSASVSSGAFTPTAVGTYYWVASYSGDANNTAVTGACGDKGETSVVHPVQPTHQKTFVSAVQHMTGGVWDGTWDVTYTVTETNPSVTVPLTYTLSDELGFPAPVTVNGGTVSGSDGVNPITVQNPTFTGGGTVGIVTGRVLAASGTDTYTVVVNATVPTNLTVDQMTCTENESAHGFFNEATVVSSDHVQTAQGCGNIPQLPNPTVTKTVTSTTQNADGSWTVVYDVAVGNTLGTLATTYDLDDTLTFGAGITVNTAGVTGPAGVNLTPGWDGAGQPQITSAAVLAAGATAHFTVTVNAKVTAEATTGDRECTPGQPGGFRNVTNVNLHTTPTPRVRAMAMLFQDDASGSEAEACSEPVSPEVTKSVVSVAQNADGTTWDVAYTVTVTNPSGTTGLVYSLDDKPQYPSQVTINSAKVTDSTDGQNPVPGILNTWDGSTLSIVSTRALPADGVDTYTVLVNTSVAPITSEGANCSEAGPGHGFYNEAIATSGDDTFTADACETIPHPVQLTILKTASVQNTSPGSSFSYTLTVTSIGTGTAYPVTVTDAIPGDLKVTQISTTTTGSPVWQGCAVSGQDGNGYGGTLTCDLSAPLAGMTTAPGITLTVAVSPSTTASAVTNTGVVTWTNIDNPTDTGKATSTVTVTLTQLPVTGGTLLLGLVPIGLLAVLGGFLLLATRRRHGGRAPSV